MKTLIKNAPTQLRRDDVISRYHPSYEVTTRVKP